MLWLGKTVQGQEDLKPLNHDSEETRNPKYKRQLLGKEKKSMRWLMTMEREREALTGEMS